MKKQSSVEWLFLMLNNPNDNQEMALKCLLQAKKMHKEEIMDACDYGIKLYINDPITSEDYYEEVYGNEDDLSDWDVTLNDGLTDEE